MRFENIALIVGAVFFSVLIIIVAEEQEAMKPREINAPVWLQIRLQQMCIALEANPDIVERDVAFLQFQYSMCREG